MGDGGTHHDDPRDDPVSVAEVPDLLREGADHFNAGRHWHAHEAWEDAWHALRAADRQDDAEFLQGMILVTAAYENSHRGKEAGFKRQMAQGLHQLRANAGSGTGLGLRDEAGWVDALVTRYLEACRARRWEAWRREGHPPPELQLAP